MELSQSSFWLCRNAFAWSRAPARFKTCGLNHSVHWVLYLTNEFFLYQSRWERRSEISSRVHILQRKGKNDDNDAKNIADTYYVAHGPHEIMRGCWGSGRIGHSISRWCCIADGLKPDMMFDLIFFSCNWSNLPLVKSGDSRKSLSLWYEMLISARFWMSILIGRRAHY